MAPLSARQFRSRFPLLSTRVYVNSCSQGALSTDVRDALDAYVESWDREGSPWERWVQEVDRLRERFARSIGAEPAEVAVTTSASAGINAIASALTFEGSRKRVVMGEFEFPTMGQIWVAQERRGAEIRWVRADGEELPPERYADLIDDRTLIVPVTHVSFRNGVKLDIASIAACCRERGAYVFLDDYQRTGSGPIDVRTLGVDFMVTGCLKYLLGPAGIAFLYVRKELLEHLQPTVTGWFARVNPFAFEIDRLDWPPTARRFETGTPAVPNAYGALAGLELLESFGYVAARERIATLSARLIERAMEGGYALATPADPARRGPLIVVRSIDAPALVARLAARGIIASARRNGLRISFHAYNDESDVDTVVDALHAEQALLERAGNAVIR